MRAGCESPWATATCALVALAACSGSVTSDSHAPRGNPAAFAITHVTVIDMSGAPPKPEMTVVISGDRIVAIGPTDRQSLPENTVVVDGRGKYVIPGLWDMHVHSTFDRYERSVVLPLYIANGVTGVRDMAADCFTACADKDTTYDPRHGPTAELVRRWKHDIATGTLLGPRMVVASAMLDGPHPLWPNGLAIRDTAEARSAVRQAQNRGADFIKVYSGLSRANYMAIADEAKRRGIPFAGHVPDAVSLEDAADAGQVSMEHLLKMSEACSSRRAEAEERARRIAAHPAHSLEATRAQILDMAQFLNRSFSLGACAPLLQRFVRDHTWQVPTLTANRGTYYVFDSAFTHDPRRQYMASEDTAWWQAHARYATAMFKATDWPNATLVFKHSVQIVGAMHRAGVRLLAGTDVSNPWVYWGSSLHDELALFVDAGLTPFEALQTATIEPARFLHATDTLGTLEPGKVADMVLLDADPLADIHNTQRIHAIVVRGLFIDSAGRDRLLLAARQAARSF
jgi:imidazolonepropionase-like amidohydrolase